MEQQVAGEAIPKSMPEPMSDARCTQAADIGQQLKDAWLKGAKEFMGGGGMLNSKPKQCLNLDQNKKKIKLWKCAPSEKPGWMMADGTTFGQLIQTILIGILRKVIKKHLLYMVNHQHGQLDQ